MGRSNEPIGTRANRIVIDNLADGTGCAGFVNSTRVDTLPVSACSVVWAIIIAATSNSKFW